MGEKVEFALRGPSDLPDLRAWLLDMWAPAAPFWRLAAMAEVHSLEPPGISTLEPHFDGRVLEDATLWWVSADMVQLIAKASDSLPPTTLNPELLPAPNGLVVFEQPLRGVDSNPDMAQLLADEHDDFGSGDVEVHAMLWGPAFLRYTRTEHLGIAMYGKISDDMWFPMGRTDWAYGSDTEAPTSDQIEPDSPKAKSMAEDRRWFATFCLLAAEKITQTTEHRPPRAVARRSARRNLSSDVRIVDVRRRHAPSGASDGEREVEWSHRWVVSGHWRQQPYGPGRSQRRPVYIHEFIKGPDEKPLVVRDTVRVLRKKGEA